MKVSSYFKDPEQLKYFFFADIASYIIYILTSSPQGGITSIDSMLPPMTGAKNFDLVVTLDFA